MIHSNGTMNKTQQQKPPIPVDRGWAWLIMIAAFVNIMLAVSFARSLSVLLPEVLERYQEPATVTTLAFGMSDLSWSLTNIAIPTLLLPRFSVRTLALFGAFCHSFALIALAYSPNIIVFNCLFGVFGLAGGLMIVPPIIHLGHFFKKRLAIASAITHAGGSIATVFVPLVTQLLLEVYGYQGALLILAGVSFNCVAASMLLRPLSMYMYPNPVKELQDHNTTDQNLEYSDCEYTVKHSKTFINDQDHEERTSEKSKFLTFEDPTNPHPRGINLLSALNMTASTEVINSNMSLAMSEYLEEIELTPISNYNTRNSISKSSISEEFKETIPFISRAVEFSNRSHQSIIDILNSKNVVASDKNDIISNSSLFLKQTSQNSSSTRDSDPVDKAVQSNLQKIYSSNDTFPQKPGSKSLEQLAPASNGDSSHFQETGATASSGCFSITHKIRANLSSSVLFNPVAVMLIVAGGLSTPGGYMYLPVLGLENGLSPGEVPWMLTIVGISDIVGKLGIGYFADLGYLRPIRIVCMTQFTIGMVCQFTMLYKGFGQMAAMAAIFGMTGGIIQALLTPMIIEMVGLQYLAPITSIYYLVTGMCTFMLNVTVGAIRDFTGSFFGGFSFLGTLLLTSFLILLLEPLFIKCRNNRDAKSINSPKEYLRK